jgi:hypothetical protein
MSPRDSCPRKVARRNPCPTCSNRRINADDGDPAAKIIQDALGIESDEVANYCFPKRSAGRRVVKDIILTAAMLAFTSTAQAQGYVIQSPGHRPAYAIPRGDGTYVIPGQKPTYLTPRGDGPYVVQSPGHRPAYAIPRGDGTYVIPGRRPTYLTPTTPR